MFEAPIAVARYAADGNSTGSDAVPTGMATATFDGTVIATSDDTVVVEGNHYFPIASVADGVLVESDHTSVCPWKGTAAYYDVVVDGQTAANAAWYYPEPEGRAAHITDRVAFHPVITVDA